MDHLDPLYTIIIIIAIILILKTIIISIIGIMIKIQCKFANPLIISILKKDHKTPISGFK